MRTHDFMEPGHAATAKAAISWAAAFLGIGTFLGIVNLAVGLLSAVWLSVQLYDHLLHERPMKRMRKQLLQCELDRASGCVEPEEPGAKEDASTAGRHARPVPAGCRSRRGARSRR